MACARGTSTASTATVDREATTVHREDSKEIVS